MLCCCIGVVMTQNKSNNRVSYIRYQRDVYVYQSTGLAGDVTFTSDPKGLNYDRYQLVWSAQSNTPITRFR